MGRNEERVLVIGGFQVAGWYYRVGVTLRVFEFVLEVFHGNLVRRGYYYLRIFRRVSRD
jgi:hypothetical protein